MILRERDLGDGRKLVTETEGVRTPDGKALRQADFRIRQVLIGPRGGRIPLRGGTAYELREEARRLLLLAQECETALHQACIEHGLELA